MSKSKAVGAVGTAVALDAATVWLRGLVASVTPDPVRAEEILMGVPALTGLCMFKEAVARASASVN